MNPSDLLSRVASLAPSAITKPEDVLLTIQHRVYLRYNGLTWRATVGVWTDGTDGADVYRDAKYQGVVGESADEVLRNALQKLALAGV